MKPLHEDHPQLFHYTTAEGLAGILKSQTLRATNYSYLNDTSEVCHFLVNRLPGTFFEVFREQGVPDNESTERAASLADSITSTLLNPAIGVEPLAEPYITSFCTTDDSRVSAHGLLSQWRAYGKAGAFALVFDTANLEQQLKEFAQLHPNSGDYFAGDVVYESDSQAKLAQEFALDLRTIKEYLTCQVLGTDDNDVLGRIFIAIMRCACRYKHWGFNEEREVRLIVVPNNADVRAFAAREGIQTTELKPKHRIRLGTPVPYIDVFESTTSPLRPLPIRRVIVGPCAEHERRNRLRAVESLLVAHNVRAEVTMSEIPYIEQ